MTTTICGSMKFHQEMRQTKKALEKMGHTVYVPKSIELMDTVGYVHPQDDEERITAKIEHDFIRAHFKKVCLSSNLCWYCELCASPPRIP